MAEDERQELQQGMVLGHYVLDDFIGGGAMGEVWRGSDRRDSSHVAVKILKAEFSKDPAFRNRFEREAHVATLLKSPYTVQTYAFGRQYGFYYLVMEFVEGDSVEKILEKGPLPLDEALEIANDAARALEAASAHKLVHRDMKPSNIIVSPDGAAKLADFGIAGQTNVRDSAGMFMGTVQYAAPEQQQGHADSRSDIYALGATLFHMLAGRPPYTGRSMEDILLQHASAPFPSPLLALQPEPVVDVVRRCMQKDPEDRYASAAELAAALERLRMRITQVRQQAPPVVSAEFRTLVPEPDDPQRVELPSGATVMLPSARGAHAPALPDPVNPRPFIPPLIRPAEGGPPLSPFGAGSRPPVAGEGTLVAPSTPGGRSQAAPQAPAAGETTLLPRPNVSVPPASSVGPPVVFPPSVAQSVPAVFPPIALPLPAPVASPGGSRRGLFIVFGAVVAALAVGGVAFALLAGGGGGNTPAGGDATAAAASSTSASTSPGAAGSASPSASAGPSSTAQPATASATQPVATATTAPPTNTSQPATATPVPPTQGPTQPPPPPTNTPAPARPVYQITGFSGNCTGFSAEVSVTGLTTTVRVSGLWTGQGQVNVSPISVPPPGGTLTMPTGGAVTPGSWTLQVFADGVAVASRSTQIAC